MDVQTGTTWASAADISKLMLQGTDGPVVLSDVATVKEQPVETTSISRVNGQTALAINVTKSADANTVSVSHAIADAWKTLFGEACRRGDPFHQPQLGAAANAGPLPVSRLIELNASPEGSTPIFANTGGRPRSSSAMP